MTRRLLGVFAHPDDETFCAGGTFAGYAGQGAEIMVVSATRGQAGQIRDAAAATRRTIGAVRETELRLACSRLGINHVRCLGYEDGNLAGADFSALVDEIAEVIEEFRPDGVITFGPDGGYGHPDHMTISAATTAACAQAARAGVAPDRRARRVRTIYGLGSTTGVFPRLMYCSWSAWRNGSSTNQTGSRGPQRLPTPCWCWLKRPSPYATSATTSRSAGTRRGPTLSSRVRRPRSFTWSCPGWRRCGRRQTTARENTWRGSG